MPILRKCNALQRSRAFVSAEMMLSYLPTRPPDQASTEPRFCERGNLTVEEMQNRKDKKLQRSRAFVSAEIHRCPR